MNTKLSCIMLIDDSISDNFLHERLIQKMGFAGHVAVMRTGHGALDHLTSSDKSTCLPPQLILLDIEMRGMNGWQFLEEFEKLSPYDKSGEVVVMLSKPEEANADEAKNPIIKDFVNKPLTEEGLREILTLHFSNVENEK